MQGQAAVDLGFRQGDRGTAEYLAIEIVCYGGSTAETFDRDCRCGRIICVSTGNANRQ